MARYMGGPRGQPKPASRAPLPPKNGDTTKATKEDDTSKSGEEDGADDYNDSSSPLRHAQSRDSIEVEGSDDEIEEEGSDDYVQDGSSEDSDEEYEAGGSENSKTDVVEITPTRLPGYQRQIRSAPRGAPLFPRLAVSSHNVDDVQDDDSLSTFTVSHSSESSMMLRRRQCIVTPGIDIEYTDPESLGKVVLEPLSLPISYGWMVKGTKEHVEDIHLSGILFCDSSVHSKRTVEVLCEYTWIQATLSQEKTGDKFPAIYVPGSPRHWKGLKGGSSLNQPDLCTAISQTIRDEHTFLQPQNPYEPTFRALEAASPSFSFNDVDIITDADTLTRLLAFICGPGASGAPAKQAFRLDLCTVRDTLFIIPKEKPGRGYAGPLRKHERSDPMTTVPEWAAQVLGRMGSDDPRLPYSGGNYRLIRYQFGDVVLAVRVKVEFVYEKRKTPDPSACDTPHKIPPEVISVPASADDISIWKTTVKVQGLGTNPGATGMATVRYTCQNQKAKVNEVIPQLWFSRTSFLVEGVVASPTLDIRDASLIDSRQYYKSFERGHQYSLRRLAGLLKYLQVHTRELGGNAVMICDPAQACLVMLKPVMETKPVPMDIVLKFWGPDDHSIPELEKERARTSESESDLTEFSKTPTPPHGSDLLGTGKVHSLKSPKNVEKASGGGRLTKPDHLIVEGIERFEIDEDWNMAARQSLKDEGYEPDAEQNTSCPRVGGTDGYTTDCNSDDNKIILDDSAHEFTCRISDSSVEKSLEDDGQSDEDGGGLMAGENYQEETTSEEHSSCGQEDGDEHYSGDSSDQTQEFDAINSSYSEVAGIARTSVEDNHQDEASGDDGMRTVGIQQGSRIFDNSNEPRLYGFSNPGGKYWNRPSSYEGSTATASIPHQLHHQPLSDSYSVDSDTETHGAATSHMD